MKLSKLLSVIVSFVILLLAYDSFYLVHEGQCAVVTQLTSTTSKQPANQLQLIGPGLHLKWPGLTRAHVFDLRLQIVNVKGVSITANEQKNLLIDYYVTWRIVNPALFYLRSNDNARQISFLIEQNLNEDLRNQCSTRSTGAIIANDRIALANALRKNSNATTAPLGVQVVDVQIEHITFSDEILSSMLNQMRAEQQRLVTQYTEDSKLQVANIQAEIVSNANLIIATAENQAAQTRSVGDAQAAKIYADAYGQDVGFYQFYRSLAAYKKVFAAGQSNILVLKPDTDFFKYFNNENGVSSHK